MANRYFEQFRYSFEKKVVDLYMKVAVGATGAPTLSTANSKGIASIARNSAGRYTITLQDKYQKLLMVDATILLASGLPAPQEFAIVSQAVTNSTPTVVVQFSAAGVATDPDNGATLYLQITLGDSSV